MNLLQKAIVPWFIISIAMFLVISCSQPDLTGTATETENVAGTLFQPDGETPAAGVYVVIRSKELLPELSGNVVPQRLYIIDSVITDNNGNFSFDTSVSSGVYIIEAASGNNAVFIDSIEVITKKETIQLPPAILKPVGAIKGTIVLAEGGDPRKVFILAFGFDRMALTDSNGTFTFNNLAEGTYNLRIVSTLDDYSVVDTMNIPVTSADTFDFGEIELPFLGIPTIHAISMEYDTLRQQVLLYWPRPDTTKIKSYNIYRRAVDPVTAIFTQLNFFPITDTFFIDSLCEPNRHYEYHIVAVDSYTNEGNRSTAVQVQTALFNITPKNVLLTYDTLNQSVTLRWSNPDTVIVNSYNIYRRNVTRNEIFWTPFNDEPVTDTFFIDSTFKLSTNSPRNDVDSTETKGDIYEYCVGALVHCSSEGVRSEGIPVHIYVDDLIPKNLTCSYDTAKQAVYLQWDRPDMTIVEGFTIFRKNISRNETMLSPINSNTIADTFYIDSTGEQNQYYNYRVATQIKNVRAQILSNAVQVHIAASFIVDTLYRDLSDGQNDLSYPNDIAIADNGDIYIVDQCTENSRILVFDSTMHYTKQIGKNILDYPLKVALDNRGSVFIANYNRERDCSSVLIFDTAGALIDTLIDSVVVNDIDMHDDKAYVLTEGRQVTLFSFYDSATTTWQASGQGGCSWILGTDANNIYVSTDALFSDDSKVAVFDTAGNRISSIALAYYPYSYALAYDDTRQLLYVVCYSGKHAVVHVLNSDDLKIATYKIECYDPNISIALDKKGNVYCAIKGNGTILKLKPLAVSLQ
ncbi:MAG: hypothetical protein JXA18_12055 [Chitinispirillaceae bacterium]|nr:hypothetical protein [Chitinispirillaceae bacterium]